MLATTVFLFFIALARSERTESLLLEDLITEYDEYTAEDVLCNDLNVSINFLNLNLNRIAPDFLSSPLIKCLNLNQNSIQTIYSNAFEKLPNLKYLDLSNNNFDVSVVLKDNFPNLETLILNNCGGPSRYNYYDYTEIKGFYPKLKKLFMKQLTNLRLIRSASKDNLPSLTHLYLSDNSIEQSDFDWLSNSLQYLDLSRNSLRSLTLTNLTNLKKLFLDDQNSNYLYIRFENLISLEHLSMQSNIIGDISCSTLQNLTSLTYLDISNNEINRIEVGSFDSLTNLQFLNLSNNFLEIIQAGTFDNLRNLHTLMLEKNVINVFPPVGQEIKLKTLFLNCNKIRSIIGGTFSKIPFLTALFLHDNEISYLDQEAFSGLQNLKILTLSNNQLSSLPHNWMLPLNSLNDLDIIGNSIRNFSDLALSESSSLKNVYLSKQLEYINAQALFAVPDNVTIHLKEGIRYVEQCDKQNDKYDGSYYG